MRNDLRALIATTLLALVLGSACASLTKVTRGVTYHRTAEPNYKKGLAELKDESYPEAIKYFNFVKNKFPFSRFATLAELRIADAYHAQEKYARPSTPTSSSSSSTPTHKDVTSGYVAYRICAGYMEQIPSDWFLVPPSHEKDQGATQGRDAGAGGLPPHLQAEQVPAQGRRALPQVHPPAGRARALRRAVLPGADKPKATILRLETLLQRYPDAGVDPEVMLLLGKTYMKLDKKEKARSTFAGLIKRHPRRLTQRQGEALHEVPGRRARLNMDERLKQLLNQGRDYYENREFERAEKLLSQVLKENRGFADVHNMLGVIYHDMGKFTQARDCFEQALEINPNYTEAALNLAVTYNELGRYKEAKEVYGKAMAHSRNQPRSLDPFAKGKLANMHMDLGDAYHGIGFFAEAVREYTQALALCPTFVDIRTKLANTYRDMGDVGAGRSSEYAGGDRDQPGLHPRPAAARRDPLLGQAASTKRWTSGRSWWSRIPTTRAP